MNADDFDAALEEAVAATGVGRYRHLTSEANTLTGGNSRESWRRWILERRWVPSSTPVPVSYGTPAAGRSCCGG